MEEILALAKRYTDSQKVTHEKKTLIEVLPETQLELSKGVNSGGYSLPTDCDLDGAFSQGKGVVVLDGVSYNVTITTIGKTRECGNKARFDGTGDTGEPFYLNISGLSKAFMLYYLEEYENAVPSSTHTLQIWGVNTKVEIDPKFLPESSGSGLPTVVLTTPVSTEDEEMPLSAEESAVFASASEMRSPVICTFPVTLNDNRVELTVVLNLMNLNGGAAVFFGEIRPIFVTTTTYTVCVMPTGDGYAIGMMDISQLIP